MPLGGQVFKEGLSVILVAFQPLDPGQFVARFLNQFHIRTILNQGRKKFFGPDGYETAQDLVGLTTVDYYGGYLDAAIEESLAQLRHGKHKLAQNK